MWGGRGENYGQEEGKGAVGAERRLALALKREHYLMAGVCQELLGPVAGQVDCACPQRGEWPALLLPHAGLPGSKREYKRDDLVKLQEAWLLFRGLSLQSMLGL